MSTQYLVSNWRANRYLMNWTSLSLADFFLGSPIAGALLTSSYTWWKPIVFCGVIAGLGTVCFFGARLFVVKEKGTVFV